MSQRTAESLEAWLNPVSQLVEPAYPWVNGLHIMSIALLGCIALLDLRLLGLFPATAVSQLALPTICLATVGLTGAILSGFLLFSVQPSHYLGNQAFIVKLAIVTAGLLNIFLLRLSPGWQSALTDKPVPAGVKLSAAVSICVWVTAVFSGRWIGYL